MSKLSEGLRREMGRLLVVDLCCIAICLRFVVFVAQKNDLAALICMGVVGIAALIVFPWQTEIERKMDIEERWRR